MSLIRSEERGRLVLHRIRPDSPLAIPLFQLFNHERHLAVSPRVRDVVDRIMSGIDTSALACVILFGSQAKGTSQGMSDIVLCFVWRQVDRDEGFQPLVRELAFPYILVEPHCYSEEDFVQVPDLVVLDSILFGISLHGHEFLRTTRSNIETIRKEILPARLDGCRELMEEAAMILGEARAYLDTVVEVGLTEMEAVLHRGVTIPRAEVEARGDHEARIARLAMEMEAEGEVVWLT